MVESARTSDLRDNTFLSSDPESTQMGSIGYFMDLSAFRMPSYGLGEDVAKTTV